MSKRTLISSAVVSSVVLLSSSAVSAVELKELHSEEAKIHNAAVKSQEKINALFEQSQDLLIEYRGVVDQTENLKVYNDYLAGLVADQQLGIKSLQDQIDSIEETKQGIVPLMFRMIDSLEQFVNLDVPIKKVERLARVDRLRDLMANSDVTVSEQFRQVIEAYLVENEYGTKITSDQGTISIGGTDETVEFFNLGRTALLALSLDEKHGWVWDNTSRSWNELDGEFLSSTVNAVRMANQQIPFDLIKLPIQAAE